MSTIFISNNRKNKVGSSDVSEEEEVTATGALQPVDDVLKYLLWMLKFCGCWPFHSATGRIQYLCLVHTLIVFTAAVSFTVVVVYTVSAVFNGDLGSTLLLSSIGLSSCCTPLLQLVLLAKYKGIHEFVNEWIAILQGVHSIESSTSGNMLRIFRIRGAIGTAVCILLFVVMIVFVLTGGMTGSDATTTPVLNSTATVSFLSTSNLLESVNKSSAIGILTTAIWMYVVFAFTYGPVIFLMYFLTTCECVSIIYDNINQKLEKRLLTNGNFRAPETSEVTKDAQTLFNQHLQLSIFVDKCSDVFGVALGLVHLLVMLQNLIISYLFITGMHPSGILQTLAFAFAMFNLIQIMACHCPAKVTNKAHSSELMLYKYLSAGAVNERENDIQLFLNRLSAHPVAFHVCNCYNIDRSVILTVYSILLSYIVVMLQLHPG